MAVLKTYFKNIKMKKIDLKQVSGMFSLSARDFLRSAILAALTPPVLEIGNNLINNVVPRFDDFQRLGTTALGTFLISIAMKFMTSNKNLKLPDEVKN